MANDLPYNKPKKRKDDAMQSMNPSKMSDAQMGKISDLLTAALRKAGFPSAPTQKVIETKGPELTEALVGVIRGYVEEESDYITRLVPVNRNLTPKQALEATGRSVYADDAVLDLVPQGQGERLEEVVFFMLDRSKQDKELSPEEVDAEYDRRGLKPADLYSIAAVNTDDPEFADSRANISHFKGSDSSLCFVGFDRWNESQDARVGYCDKTGFTSNSRWWLAGVRK